MPEATPEELIERWHEFLREADLIPRVMALADAYPEVKALELDFAAVDRFDADLGLVLLERPQAALYAAEEAIRRSVPPSEEPVALRLRVKGLPKDSRVEIRELRSRHLGKFLSISGLVRKVTEVRPKVVEALFRCLRCNAVIREDQEGMGFREPLECYKDEGGCGRSAGATKFMLLTEKSRYIDTQKIEIQEAPEGLRGGEQPQRLTAYLDEDLTGRINPGARVILNGVLRSVQKGRAPARSTLFDLFLDVNSVELQQVEFEEIEVTPEDVIRIKKEAEDPEIFSKIVGSIAPSIFGLETEKEALALQLFGGVPKHMPDGRRIRGDIHCLLVGDPGTGKSELLSYMSRLSPRGVYASGQAASGPGLTAAAVRDEFGEGRWTLEAGAMVLSDMGLACIDELEKMNPNDRSSIHEILEQQRLSVAKAGITATLQARCALLAAANPKFGRFDEHKYIAEQVALDAPLLSRFDCIFPIIDRPESSRDRAMAEYVLKGHLVGEMRRRQEDEPGLQIDANLARPYEPHFPPDFLRKYVAYAKRIYPIMTPDAMKVISDKYLEIRRQGEMEGAAVPITPRQLEAFVRMSEASARARLSPLVTAEDAERAVRIVEYWLRKVTGIEGRFDIDIVATGISTSQREQIIILRDIIQELAGTDGVADLEDIVERAEQRGIPATKVEQYLKRWQQEGEVYSPARNKYRLVSRG